MTQRRLTLSDTDKKLAGVCGGIAEYYGIDSTHVRIGYAILTLFAACFPGVLLYLILMFVMPRRDNFIDNNRY